MNNPVKIIWNNRDIIIFTGSRCKYLDTALKYTHKYFAPDPSGYGQIVKRKSVNVYNVFLDKNNDVVYQTHQGLLDIIINIFNKYKISYSIEDRRSKFPPPQLQRMHGFRFNQEAVLTKALTAERSGIIKAPTRYGKTVLITNTVNAYPNLKIASLAPGVEVLKETKALIQKYCPDRKVKLLCNGSDDKTESEDITVCSFDSLHKLDKQSYDLVLIDEPHAIVTESRAPQLTEFSKARFLGFGATTENRWSGNDIMITGMIGPILSETTYKECVEIGALCPIHVYMINFPYTPLGYERHLSAYNNYMFKNLKFCKLVGDICNNYLPKEFQTLIFIDNEKQANILSPYINDSMIAMDKLFKNKKQRESIFQDLKNNTIKRCICSNIYSTGVTINEIRAEINCAGGGGNIMAVQKPGRLAEIKPGKSEGIMIDFMFIPTKEPKTAFDKSLYRDSVSRLNKYQEKGYNITLIDNIENLNFK